MRDSVHISVKPKVELRSDPENKNLVSGTNVTLICKVEASPSVTITWTKDSTPLVLSSAPQQDGASFISEQRFMALLDTAGRYECEASNVAGTDVRDVNLVVEVLLTSSLPEESTIEVLSGDNLSLFCNVTGYPKPNFTWTTEDDPDDIISESATLLLSSDEEMDDMVYTCTASSGNHELKRTFIIIEIAPPVIQSIFPDKEKEEYKESAYLRLVFRAKGEPPPMYTLLKDDGILQTNMIEIDYGKVIERGDAGKYTFQAENKLGRVQRSLLVFVLVKLVVDKHDDDSIIYIEKGRKEHLECPVKDGYPVPKITWFANGITVRNNKMAECSVQMSRERNEGNYTCCAAIKEVFDCKSFNVRMKSSPKITDLSVLGKVEMGKRISLICSVSGVPQPEITWWRKKRRSMNLIIPRAHPRFIILPDGNKLIISNLRPEDSAQYVCKAKNIVNEVTKEKAIKVKQPTSLKRSKWGHWSSWTKCTDCGVKMRYRNCMGTFCSGPGMQWDSIHSADRKERGTWDKWSSWSTWNNCGAATLKRQRKCRSPGECKGPKMDSKRVYGDSCKTDGHWTTWSPWGQCSTNCGKGTQRRTRQCADPIPQFKGRYCNGDDTETSFCNLLPC